MKILIATCFAALLALPTAIWAQSVAPADTEVQRVRGVIEGQLDAFAADDAERAFSFAAPTIRQMFGTPERFMAMVQAGYPVVYRPASVVFLQPQTSGGDLLQAVQMTDAAGAAWLVLYRMQRQADRSWRIAGVELRQTRARAI